MKLQRLLFPILFAGLAMTGCKQAKPEAETSVVSTPDAKLIATVYNSGFEHSHDTYNGISSASDGKIYYVLCSQLIDVAGQMYSFDPKTGKIEHLGDLTEICGEKDMNVVAQGKSHVNFVESNGKLYFATHLGYYSIIDGMEKPGAGSVATADLLVRNMMKLAGVPLLHAIQMITTTPAQICRIENRKGSLTAGKDADKVIFEDNILVKTTIINGRVVANKL